MAVSFPTLSVGFDTATRLTTTPRLRAGAQGDGHIQRTPDGINYKPRTYNIVFRALSATDTAILRPFLEDALDGRAVTIPLWNIDFTGATTANFYVESYDMAHDTSGALTDFSIRAVEVFDA